MLNLSQCQKPQKNIKKNSIYSSNKFNAKECLSKFIFENYLNKFFFVEKSKISKKNHKFFVKILNAKKCVYQTVRRYYFSPAVIYRFVLNVPVNYRKIFVPYAGAQLNIWSTPSFPNFNKLQFFFKLALVTWVHRWPSTKQYLTVHSNKNCCSTIQKSQICYNHLYMSYSTFSHKRTTLKNVL